VTALEVIEPGLLALIQDEGRPGHMAVGVGRAGAADRASYALVNRLVGNAAGAAAIEVTLGGLRVRADGDLVVALTGAPTDARVEGRRVGHTAVLHLPAGARLELGRPATGLRTYLAVRGGIATDPVLGSRSTDTMSGLGPAPLAPGMVLPVGAPTGAVPPVDAAPVGVPDSGRVTVDVLPGPRLDWLAEPASLDGTTWTVSEQSDRRGVRLLGTPLRRSPERTDSELSSEGMVRGAIQVPPGGEPVVLLNDHPVTGGYPVVGVIRTADVDRVAQLVPGQAVRLRWVRP
jgi:biotin-dependent carboxylase-like uncharacterized protein